jgi:hypothetical protein
MRMTRQRRERWNRLAASGQLVIRLFSVFHYLLVGGFYSVTLIASRIVGLAGT